MTLELIPFLKQMLSLPGLSGNEAPIREVIADAWRPFVDEFSTSPLGSLHGLRRGQAAEPRPRILLAAHMDAIGLMVTGIADGFLRFTEIGGIDPRILPGQAVIVHGQKDLPAIVVQPADRLVKPEHGGSPLPMSDLLIDTGLLPDEVKSLIKVGDLVSFAIQPTELSENILYGHSQDNRASVAVITACLLELQHIRHDWDVWAVASTQEEETLGGGYTSPFAIRPTVAVAIDVTFAKGPGANDWRAFGMGKGPTLGFGPNIHPALHNRFKSVAEKLDIPHQVEIMPRHSGTDAFAMQVVAEGIPSMVIGIPLRYMHTPVEMVSVKDIERAGHLLAQVIAGLAAEDVNSIRWEDTND